MRGRLPIGLSGQIGILCLLLAGILIIEPELFEPIIEPATVDAHLEGMAGWGLFIALVGIATLQLFHTAPVRTEPPRLLSNRLDSVSKDREIIGSEFDELYESAIDAGAFDQTKVKRTLRSKAVEVLAVTNAVSSDAASSMVETGSWSDDPIVAAYVSGADGPDPPLRWRLYAWLYPDAYFERAVERTIDELDRTLRGKGP